MKLKLYLIIICLAVFNSFGYNIQLTWGPSTNDNISNYSIYYGTNSKVYTDSITVGNITNTVITNLINTTYFFSVKAVDIFTNKSAFSEETTYTLMPDIITNQIVYVGTLLEYGTNISNLSSKKYLLKTFTNMPPLSFRAYLVQHNKPFNSNAISDSNNSYLYLGAELQYGTDLETLITENIDFAIFTNPPAGQSYRASLLIQNKGDF